MIRIVTDSSSDMSSHHAAELGVTVVPMRINFGNRVYSDGLDIDRADFFRHLPKSMVLPTAEPPLPEDFQRVYGGLLADNAPSRHVVESLGFTYVGSLYEKVVFGRATRWRDKVLAGTGDREADA